MSTTIIMVPPGESAPRDPDHAGDSALGHDIQLQDITITYRIGGTIVTPVEGLSCFAPAGRVTALVGPSGSGKTSILSCIAASLRPASGAITVGQTVVTDLTGRALDRYRREVIGVVHQDHHLIPSLTVLENVRVPGWLIGQRRSLVRNRSLELLNRLGLGDHLRHRPHQLSGGQRQRVAIARALMADPAIVIADEPTAHLDQASIAEVRAVLRDLADEGRTILVSTHDDRLATAADHIVGLAGG